jgi:hypothetical protein
MIDIATADTYFLTKVGAELWTGTATITTDQKTRLLSTAENQIRSCGEWIVPSTYETNLVNAICDAYEDYQNGIKRKQIDVLSWEYKDQWVYPGPSDAWRWLLAYRNPNFDYNIPGGSGGNTFSF